MTRTDPPTRTYPGRLRLDGRALVVVGAGQGMGRETSHALAQSGARVVCADIDADRARQVDEVARLVHDAVGLLNGPLSGFVDIVGMAEWAAVLDMDPQTWDAQFSICLRHAHLLSRHIGRHMIETGTAGTMTFISSLHGLTASVHHAAYGAAKAGLVSLVKTLASELGPRGIRANAVAPGSILTPRILAAGTDALRERAAAVAPLKRNGSPSDVASAALFLTSDLSAFVTGQTIAVDGGVSIIDPFESLLS